MLIRSRGLPARHPLLAIALLAGLAQAYAQQPGQKKEFAFRGKIEQVDAASMRLTVTNEPIEGWMRSMTMAFKVSNEDVIPRLNPGDQISAKVYEGDFTLYDVAVVPQSTQPSAQSQKALPGSGATADLLRDALARPALDRRQFEELALANNPTLRQAAAVLQRSAGQARQAGLYPNPSFGYQGEQIRGGDFRGGEQGAFIQQTIPLGGKPGLRRNVFEQQRRADEIGATEQRYRVLSEIGQSFYSALAALQTAKLRQQLLSLALDAVQPAHQLSNVGQADAPDVLQAEVEAEQAQVDYIGAQRSYIREFRNLAARAGKPDLPLVPLAGDLEAPPGQ